MRAMCLLTRTMMKKAVEKWMLCPQRAWEVRWFPSGRPTNSVSPRLLGRPASKSSKTWARVRTMVSNTKWKIYWTLPLMARPSCSPLMTSMTSQSPSLSSLSNTSKTPNYFTHSRRNKRKAVEISCWNWATSILPQSSLFVWYPSQTIKSAIRNCITRKILLSNSERPLTLRKLPMT